MSILQQDLPIRTRAMMEQAQGLVRALRSPQDGHPDSLLSHDFPKFNRTQSLRGAGSVYSPLSLRCGFSPGNTRTSSRASVAILC